MQQQQQKKNNSLIHWIIIFQLKHHIALFRSED